MQWHIGESDLEWLNDNKEWLFSGVGAVLLAGIAGWIWRKVTGQRTPEGSARPAVNQKQRGGAGSRNTQVGIIDKSRR